MVVPLVPFAKMSSARHPVIKVINVKKNPDGLYGSVGSCGLVLIFMSKYSKMCKIEPVLS
jgi:hypothetical protein